MMQSGHGTRLKPLFTVWADTVGRTGHSGTFTKWTHRPGRMYFIERSCRAWSKSSRHLERIVTCFGALLGSAKQRPITSIAAMSIRLPSLSTGSLHPHEPSRRRTSKSQPRTKGARTRIITRAADHRGSRLGVKRLCASFQVWICEPRAHKGGVVLRSRLA